MYPGYDVARQISGPPVLFDPIVDEDIPTSTLNYDIAWTGDYNAVFIELTRCQSDLDGTQLYMLMSSDGGATFPEGASDYRFRCNSEGTATATQAGDPGTIIGMTTLSGIGSAANETGDFSIILPSPPVIGRKSAIIWGGHIKSNALPVTDLTYGYRDTLTIVDAVRFRNGGGGLWTSGRARAFGLRRA